MELAGKTTDGKPVMSDVGELCFTRGVPLEVVLTFFKEKDLIVDWTDYIKSALLDGHNPRTIRARIDSATADVYGKVYSAEVMTRTDRVLNWLTSS